MATISTVAILNAKCMSIKSPRSAAAAPPAVKPISLLSLHNLPKGLALFRSLDLPTPLSPLVAAAIAGAIFSALSASDAAFAAQQVAEIAEGDNRGLALLLPIVPAILWVLYNILQPALNQLNRMNSEKGVIVGLGLGGGLAAHQYVRLLRMFLSRYLTSNLKRPCSYHRWKITEAYEGPGWTSSRFHPKK